MAKPICVTLAGVESTFAFKAVDRVAVYGKRRRVALDRTGAPCSRASLLEDGSLLLKSGMTGQGYFLPDGTFLRQADLEAYDDSGKPLDKLPSTLGTPEALTGPVDPTEVLDLRVDTIYALDPDSITDELAASLEDGAIYRFTFRFRDDFATSTAFLLANENGAFALIGTPLTRQWASLQMLTEMPADDEDSDDDLDFEMF